MRICAGACRIVHEAEGSAAGSRHFRHGWPSAVPCYPYMKNKSKETRLEKRARLTSKGQVTIPAEIRRELRIGKGDVLIFEADAGGVRLRPLRQRADVFAEYEGAWREGEGETTEEINAWLRELRGHEG